MSGVLSLAKPHRIKASHRRRWKGTTGHRLYIMNNPSGTDPTGYVSCTGKKDAADCEPVKETRREAPIGSRIKSNTVTTTTTANSSESTTTNNFGHVTSTSTTTFNGAKGQSAKPVGTSNTASRESSGSSTTATADTLGPNAVRVGNGTTIKDTVSAQMRMEMANRYIGAVNEILNRGDGATFSSPEAAARMFRDLFASMSGYLGLEFGGNVEPVYDYLGNAVKDKFKLADLVSSRSADFDNKTNFGWRVVVPLSSTAVAWMHTHPDLNFNHRQFSISDTTAVTFRHSYRGQDAYVFYPEGFGRQFDSSKFTNTVLTDTMFYEGQNKYAPEFK